MCLAHPLAARPRWLSLPCEPDPRAQAGNSKVRNMPEQILWPISFLPVTPGVTPTASKNEWPTFVHYLSP
jgi:hypothetical protein